MKVKDLIKVLENVDPERVVVMSIDPEGNGYNELREWDSDMMYDRQDGEVGLGTLTEEDIKDGYGEADLNPDGEPAIVFWP